MKTCLICGKTFMPKSSCELYCSPECRKEATNQRNRKYPRKPVGKRCAVCGKLFEIPQGHKKKYCSDNCRRTGRKLSWRGERAYKNAQDLLDKALKRVPKKLDDWCREATQCGLDYGTYRALIERGKTFEELNAQYRQRELNDERTYS